MKYTYRVEWFSNTLSKADHVNKQIQKIDQLNLRVQISYYFI